MSSEPLLTPGSFAVWCRLPDEWTSEAQVRNDIAREMGWHPVDVARRMARLRALGLVERRKEHSAQPRPEIRRRAEYLSYGLTTTG